MSQPDLLGLFDDFGVTTSRDYHKLPPGTKPIFISRLYKSLSGHQAETLRDLRQAGGLKLHFASGTGPEQVPNVPGEESLKKMAFYAYRTLVTVPFREVSAPDMVRIVEKPPKQPNRKGDRRKLKSPQAFTFGEVETQRKPDGGELIALGNVHHVDPVAFDELLSLLCNGRPFIKAGILHVLPAFHENRRELSAKSLGLLSANFSDSGLRHQFEETAEAGEPIVNPSGLTRLYLPYFRGLSIQDVLELRSNDTDVYENFQRSLEKLIYKGSEAESEQALLDYMHEVDLGIRGLHERFKQIQAKYRRKNIYLMIGFASVALVMFAPAGFMPAVSSLAALIGGQSTVFKYLETRDARREEESALRAKPDVYLAWRLYNIHYQPKSPVREALARWVEPGAKGVQEGGAGPAA